MKKVIPFCSILIMCFSCSTEEEMKIDSTPEIEINKGLSALDFNNQLMMSQSMIHTKIVHLWDAENDSVRRSNLNDLSFDLNLHLEKIEGLNSSRTFSPNFKSAVIDYFHFVESNERLLQDFVRLSADSTKDLHTDQLNKIADEFSQGYNIVMDSISSKQEKFARLNKVKLN